jgi:hypothetical protein
MIVMKLRKVHEILAKHSSFHEIFLLCVCFICIHHRHHFIHGGVKNLLKITKTEQEIPFTLTPFWTKNLQISSHLRSTYNCICTNFPWLCNVLLCWHYKSICHAVFFSTFMCVLVHFAIQMFSLVFHFTHCTYNMKMPYERDKRGEMK